MNQLFCLKCNKPTPYISEQPRHCSHCGKAYLEGNASIPAQRPAPPAPPRVAAIAYDINDDDDADENSISNFSSIDKIEYDTGSLRPNRERVKLDIGNKEVEVNSISAKKQGRPVKQKNIKNSDIEKVWATQFPKSTHGNSRKR
jgi:hypothetical protein